MRPTEYTTFMDRFNEILQSDGKECLPNVKEITDLQEGLNLIRSTDDKLNKSVTTPYRFLIREFEAVPPSKQTKEICWYPKFFLNSVGMGSTFDGSGVFLCTPSGRDHNAKVFTFAFCEHEWDTSGSNHSRGWHRKVCTKCGVDASIDSGD
jgi:hypothetical protein